MLLFWATPGSTAPSSPQFMDETGINPLPVGVFVRIYPGTGPQNASTLVGSGFIGTGGNVNITLQSNTAYVAVFSGTQAPIVSVAFSIQPPPVNIGRYGLSQYLFASYA